MTERRCIVSRETLPDDRLVRFVAAPDGSVVPDLTRRLPGRGLWVCATREAIEEAHRKNLFAKAAKQNLTRPHVPGVPDAPDGGDAPADYALWVGGLLRRRALDFLGLLRKSGDLIFGAEKVKDRLNRARDGVAPGLLISASDASLRERDRLFSNIKHINGQVPVITAFSRAELALALGMENVVSAAVEPGRLCEKFLVAARLVEDFDPEMQQPDTQNAG